MSPMQLHRTYGTCHDDITCLDWSPDSIWIAVGAKDLTHRQILPPAPRPPPLSARQQCRMWSGGKVRYTGRMR